jgi:hypothetical protein
MIEGVAGSSGVGNGAEGSRTVGKGTIVKGRLPPSSSQSKLSVRPTVEEVQSLLDEAVSMSHQIVTLSSSSKSDEEMAESLRSVLGDLLRVLLHGIHIA